LGRSKSRVLLINSLSFLTHPLKKLQVTSHDLKKILFILQFN